MESCMAPRGQKLDFALSTLFASSPKTPYVTSLTLESDVGGVLGLEALLGKPFS